MSFHLVLDGIRGDNMRIILADDQFEVRSGIKILLGQESDVDIIGEAEELGSLLTQTKERNPDMVLLDWELSNLKVSDIIPVLRMLHPDIKIVALSSRPESLNSALAAGVDAFVSKGDQPEKLLDTIRGFQKK